MHFHFGQFFLHLLLLALVGVMGQTLSQNESVAIEKLRDLAGNSLYEDYMKTDAFLITWLRARNFNVAQANEMLQKALVWRKENSIDTILQEDFSDLSRVTQGHLYYADGTDRENRPVGTIPVGAWDLRGAVISGKGHRVRRLLDQLLEIMATRLRETNATQCIIIFDASGFNLRQHGCLACTPFIVDTLLHYENYYPGLIKHLIFVNVPRASELVFHIINGLFSPVTREVIKVFGHNKNEWRKYILELIPEDQLRAGFGGTKEH